LWKIGKNFLADNREGVPAGVGPTPLKSRWEGCSEKELCHFAPRAKREEGQLELATCPRNILLVTHEVGGTAVGSWGDRG